MAISRHSQPTLEMVAERAGVSRATVSRVVNGSPKVSPDVAQAVKAAVDELGYVPNRAARMLVSRQSHAIALVVPEDMTRLFADPYLASIVVGINNRIARSDYVLNLIVPSHDPGGKTMRYLLGGNVDGAFVVSHHTSDTFIEQISKALPVVFGGRPPVPIPEAYVVDVDNVAGARQATQHLLSIGRQRIAHVAGPETMPAALDRVEGYLQAVRAAGLEPGPVVSADFTLGGGAEAMREILAKDPSIDAVFVASDLMAAGAIPVLRGVGKSIPGDVAVVGYDDSVVATTLDTPLTTIRQPAASVGARMADVLMDLLKGDKDVDKVTILPTELVRRASA